MSDHLKLLPDRLKIKAIYVRPEKLSVKKKGAEKVTSTISLAS